MAIKHSTTANPNDIVASADWNADHVITDDINMLDYAISNIKSIAFNDGDKTITEVKDEDDMASNSDTMICTQQSIKAYVDGKVSDLVYGAGWNGITTIAPSKNAVYDTLSVHYANASAHHTKYSDADARGAINNIFGADGHADSNIDLDKHQLIEAVIENRADWPAGPVAGQQVFRTDYNNGFIFNGTTWRSAAPGFFIVVASDGTGDYLTIQEGIDALPAGGGIVHVKTGVYTITSQIEIKVSNTTLEGEFRGTVIQTTTDGINLIHNWGQDRIVIKDLYLYGGGAGKNNDGINWGTSHEGMISNVYVENCEDGGVLMFGAEGNKIVNCRVRDCWNYGIYLNGCDYNILTNNFVKDILLDSFGVGILSTGTYTNTINNNHVEGCEQEGAYIHSSDYINFEGNQVFNNSFGNVNAHAGILLAGGSTHNSIVGNKSYDDQGVHTQKYGVREAAAADDWNLITNNVCVDNQTAEVSKQGLNSIEDNNITGP